MKTVNLLTLIWFQTTLFHNKDWGMWAAKPQNDKKSIMVHATCIIFQEFWSYTDSEQRYRPKFKSIFPHNHPFWNFKMLTKVVGPTKTERQFHLTKNHWFLHVSLFVYHKKLLHGFMTSQLNHFFCHFVTLQPQSTLIPITWNREMSKLQNFHVCVNYPYKNTFYFLFI